MDSCYVALPDSSAGGWQDSFRANDGEVGEQVGARVQKKVETMPAAGVASK